MQSQLIQACRDKDKRTVAILLDHNASPHSFSLTNDIPNMLAVTPLMIAAYRSHEPIVPILLQYPSERVDAYSYALYVAAFKSRTPSENIIRMVLEKAFEALGSTRLVDFAYAAYAARTTEKQVPPFAQRLMCDSYGMCALFKSTDIVGKLRMFAQ